MSAVITENVVCQGRHTATTNSSRLAWLDFGRMFAAYSIVWLHTPRSPQLASWTVVGRFAVPFFTAGAVFFVIDGLRRQPNRTLREYTVNRFRRIYLPFLAWSVIYLAFKAAKKLFFPDEPNDFSGIEVLWTGTFWHLWFMPFILVVTLSTFVIGQLILGRPNVERVMCLAMVAMGLVLSSIEPPARITTGTRFCLLAWNALPAACWGLGLALVFPSGLNRIVATRTASLIAVCSFSTLVVWLAVFGRNDFVENTAGVFLLVAALQPKSPRLIMTVGRFGAVAFGIYLAHLLLIKMCESVAAKLHWSISWQLDLLIFVIAAVGSTWLAWVLAQSRRTRWLAA